MKRPRMIGVVLTCIVAGASIAAAAEEKSLKEILAGLLPGMGAERIPDRRGPQQQWQNICFQLGAPGKEAQRAEACELMAGKLGPEIAKPARIWMLKQLEYIGRDECVDAVAGLLDDSDEHVRDAARRALANNPAPEANVKLLAALADAGDGRRQVALVNALGYRSDQASVAALGKMLLSGDKAVVAAAANALGTIGGPDAAEVLRTTAPELPRPLRILLADGYLRCADGLLAEGKTQEALRIYRQLYRPRYPRTVRLPALQGILNASGNEAASAIVKLLTADDPDARAVAAGHIEKVSGAAAMKTFATEFPNLPPAGQILLLGGLAAKGDKSAMPVAVEAAKSENLEVKVAAVRSLAKLGDASVVRLLTETISAGGEPSGPARNSLRRVFGEGVDKAIIDVIKEADVPLRGTLIDVLNDRRAVVAVPALLKEAEHQDSGIRERAIRALGNLADPGSVPEMIELLLKTQKGRRRDDAEKAIMFACNRISDEQKRADPVLAALVGASDADRVVLLPLLGRIGGERALVAIQAALGSGNANVQEAAVRGLCNWPDAGVAEQLLKLSQSAQQKSHRLWALRAFIRVIALPSDRPNAQKLAMLKGAMQLSTRDEERKLILERAAAVRQIETLRFVAPYLDNKELAQRACRTVVDLAHHRDLRQPNKAEFDTALRNVLRICKDRNTVDRAKEYMSEP